MANARKSRAGRRREFLDNYKVEDTYLLRPDRSKGRPGIYAGTASDGGSVLIKVWPRGASPDPDLEEIWRHELRQLHRLAGYPGAADCIAHLLDAGSDSAGFYLVLDPGQRQPLQTLIDRTSQAHWLKQHRPPANRARTWANLRLLALGIESLHSQGLLHRNIDTWAVLTAGGDEPDFQLTGFEWSMRVSAPEGSKVKRVAHNASAEDSFIHDWKLFGFLAAFLVGVKPDRLGNRALVPHEIAEHLTIQEARLLRNLVQLPPFLPVNGEVVVSRIDEVLRELRSEIANREAKRYLAIRVGSGSALSDRIREVSSNDIEVADIEGQLAFVKDDLAQEVMLIALRPMYEGADMRLLLRGRNLTYQLQQYRHPKTGIASWEIAYTEFCEKAAPAPVNILGHRILEPASLEVVTSATAAERFARLRGKVSSWDELKTEFAEGLRPTTPETVVYQALSLVQLLEALFACADVFPVEIIQLQESGKSEKDGQHILRVKSRADPERDALSRALGLKSPTVRLPNTLTGANVRSEGWILSENGSLGERDHSDTEWRYQDTETAMGKQDAFVFTGTVPPPQLKDAYLIPEGSVGRDAQFRRRLRALRALREHHELLRMLAAPRRRILDSHEELKEDEAFVELDGPKQQALKELIATLPMYLVQGPPGVGKTRLVRDLVRRRFEEEPTSRLLLTAQSNAAVDHLMDELEPLLNGLATTPLVVRCVSRDNTELQSAFDITDQSEQIVGQLAVSKLAARLPAKLRTALGNLRGAVAQAKGERTRARGKSKGAAPKKPSDSESSLRAIEGVIARAANIVFATANSAELDRLIEERGQFDWAIVEEAGKATGSELVSPLLLSHRRLMIGDHKQLPPFGSDQLAALLEQPNKVQEAIAIGEEFVGRALRDDATDEVLDVVEDEQQQLPALCGEALRVLTLFGNLIDAELERQDKTDRGRPIAKRLTDQHRMHPDIAQLVSRCFYQGKLNTHPRAAERFKRAAPFDTSEEALPHAPIVVVDMPYVQSAVGKKCGEEYPRWVNPMEVEAVLKVLASLRARAGDRPPTLAILSPYAQQVQRISSAVADLKATKLKNLDGFAPATHSGKWAYTVDSFQGSEADVIVISLTRNNGHSNVRNALGFLTDRRRMNVLMSRARWKLILVTSVQFLNVIVTAAKGGSDEQFVDFIIEMLNELNAAELRGAAARVPFDSLS